jgi:hypothetical protein
LGSWELQKKLQFFYDPKTRHCHKIKAYPDGRLEYQDDQVQAFSSDLINYRYEFTCQISNNGEVSNLDYKIDNGEPYDNDHKIICFIRDLRETLDMLNSGIFVVNPTPNEIAGYNNQYLELHISELAIKLDFSIDDSKVHQDDIIDLQANIEFAKKMPKSDLSEKMIKNLEAELRFAVNEKNKCDAAVRIINQILPKLQQRFFL